MSDFYYTDSSTFEPLVNREGVPYVTSGRRSTLRGRLSYAPVDTKSRVKVGLALSGGGKVDWMVAIVGFMGVTTIESPEGAAAMLLIDAESGDYILTFIHSPVAGHEIVVDYSYDPSGRAKRGKTRRAKRGKT